MFGGQARLAQAVVDQQSADKTDVVVSTVGLRFVRVPAGSFVMGSPEAEVERDSDETEHTVAISRPFLMGATEVTRGAFAKFVSSAQYKTTAENEGWAMTYVEGRFTKTDGGSWSNPGTPQTDDHPVVCVSWHDAVAFCNWLSEQDGLKPCYTLGEAGVTCDFAANGYRLPTEAEWEYACRAGTTAAFNTGPTLTTDQANFNGNHPYGDGPKGLFRAATTAAGTFPANAWGLCDMHCNVWEWCWDYYDAGYYAVSHAADPAGPVSGAKRVTRGGSWDIRAAHGRSAHRGSLDPATRYGSIGFRVVRNAPAQE